MAYRYYNANPNNANIMDCSVRAVSVLESIPWSEAYKRLSNFARKRGLMMDSVEAVEEYLDSFYDRVPTRARTVGEFVNYESEKGKKYAITMNGHISSIVDKEIVDTFDPSNRELWSVWEIE